MYKPKLVSKDILKKFSGLILYILITILVISLYGGKYGFLEKLSSNTQDGMFKLRGGIETPPAEIIIVGIDDRSTNQIGRWPWQRDLLAQLISAISQGSPKLIGLDIFLPEDIEEDTSGRTRILAQEIYAAGNVILPIYFNLSDVGIAPLRTPEPIVKSAIGGGRDYSKLSASLTSARQIYYPSQALTDASHAFGHINIDYDADGLIRREPLIIDYDGYSYPSFGLQLAAQYLKTDRDRIKPQKDGGLHVGNIAIPADKRQRMLVNYHGPNLSFKRISAVEVLNGETDPKMFAQKIVLVGLTTAVSKSWALVPSFGEINEVERIATVAENIIHHNFLKPLPGFWNLLVLILIGIFCALVLPKVSLTYRIVILLVFLFVVFNLTYILFSSFGILTQPVYPMVELLFFLIAAPAIKPKSMQKEKTDETDMEESRRAGLEDHPQKALSESVSKAEEVAEKTQEAKEEDLTGISVKEPASDKPKGIIEPETPSASKTESVLSEKKDSERLPPSPSDLSAEKTVAFSKTPATPAIPEISSYTPAGGSSPSVTQFGRYKIIELLGKGGMGTVYKGLDPVLDRSVALKTIRLDFALSSSEISELKARLIQEAKAAGMLSHPNIVTIYDVGEEGGLHYIAMEYLSGYTLEEFIQKKGELNYRIVAKIIMQACDALSYAHQHGIVHRDIKPANIMLLEDFHVKVMDFGIARLETASLTKSNVAMGTPYYISPEQIEGKPADKRSDIFSLGVVIYELLTRQKPFQGENISSLMYRILNQEPIPPSRVNEKTPLVFDRIVAKCIAKRPEERYQEAEEISKSLREFISSFVVTRSVRI
jgi:CHASE2 domain-containing sensor protein/tRNA A-37 threonylcarbamoyl transferase component Bud32